MTSTAQFIEQARQHARAGRPEAGRAAMEQCVSAAPTDAEAWNELGTLELAMNDVAAAARSFARAVELDPHSAIYHHHYGSTLRRQEQWAAAEAEYRLAIECNADQFDSYVKLAELCERRGAVDEAVETYRRAIALRPKNIVAMNALGILLHNRGRYDEAIVAYEQALKLEPNRPELQHNLGNTFRTLGRFEEAATRFRQATRLKPDYAKAHYHLGATLHQQGKPNEALAALQMALIYNDKYAEAHDELGNVLVSMDKDAEAVECYQSALRLRPDLVNAWGNLGTLLNTLGRRDEALRCLSQAVKLDPNLPEAHNNLGNVYKAQHRLEEAKACYERALQLRPHYGKAHYNLGNIYLEYGQLDEADRSFETAIKHSPKYPEANFQHGALHLLRGDYPTGWAGYEWRWGMQNAVKGKREFLQPTWDGSPLDGKTILLYTEQGFGDTIQFIRYAPLVKARGGRVVVECQPRMIPLLRGCEGIDELVPRGEGTAKFDVQAALLSLPAIFQTDEATIPCDVPYFKPDPKLVEKWRGWLDLLSGFRVGIVWQGSPTFLRDATRSIPLAHFAPLAAVPGVRLIALQKGTGTEQLLAIGNRVPVVTLPDDVDSTAGGYMDTAAIMQSLDLVISSDTSAAHLAGALGRPCWVALGYVPDWRWLLDRSDTPWYPSLQLFRQKTRGDWNGVFQELATRLRQVVSSRTS